MTRRDVLRSAECPVARSLGVVGEPWSLMIVRDVMDGVTRFDDLLQHLKVSPTTLTRRLRSLVNDGVLERRRYLDHPPRHEYLLTERGQQLASVMLALGGWWNTAVDPEARPIIIVDNETGDEVEPIVIDARTGQPIEWPRHRFGVGPTASERAKKFLTNFQPEQAAS